MCNLHQADFASQACADFQACTRPPYGQSYGQQLTLLGEVALWTKSAVAISIRKRPLLCYDGLYATDTKVQMYGLKLTNKNEIIIKTVFTKLVPPLIAILAQPLQ